MEREEDLQCGGSRLIQDSGLYRFSQDSVLLARFAQVKRGERVVDLGAGSGVLCVLMHARQPDAEYRAIELQAELFSLLERNFSLNGIRGPSRAVLADMREAPVLFGTANDVCVCNPPFEKAGSGAVRLGPTQEIARTEAAISLAEVCETASRCLRWGGRLYMAHRTARLPEIFVAMCGSGLEPKLLRLCAGSARKEPRSCLVMGKKGAGSGLRVLPTLVAREEDGSETEEIRRIYGSASGEDAN